VSALHRSQLVAFCVYSRDGMHETFQAATETRPRPSLRDVAALETLAETYGNKKLSYCCDG